MMIFSHSDRAVIAFVPARFRAWLVALLAGILACASVAAFAQATPGSPTVLVIGDSLSAGYGLSAGQGWVELLQKKLAAHGFAHRIVNASISGDTTAGGRSRIGAALQAHKPDIVIIELGGNDGLRGATIQSVKSNLDFIVETAQRAGAQVLLLGMQLPPNYGPAYVRQFSALFSDVAKSRNTGFVPFFLQGFGDKPEMFQPDRIHPTAQAQPLMVETIWPELKKLLSRQP
jgi:acyl-CoA thioesterase-1